MIEINRNPSRRDLRVFAIGLTVLANVAGWWLKRRWGLEWAPYVGFAAGAAAALAAIGRPESLRRVYVGWMIAVSPIGWVVSYVLLGLVYYGVVTPLALVQRLRGRDPLERSFDRRATTYWKARGKRPDPKSYFEAF